MSYQNLEAALQAAGNPVELLRNSQIGPYAFPVVRHEFTNWRDEQRSWRETCALFDQSHHMTDLYIEGPDALKLLSDLGVNSFKNFKVNQAKQFVACNPDGYVIGDAILFYLDENKLSLVGRPPAAQLGALQPGDREDTKRRSSATSDPRSIRAAGSFTGIRSKARTRRRSWKRSRGRPAPDIRFFNMGVLTIAGHDVRALRHGMVGQPGWEIFGPWEQGEDGARTRSSKPGKEFGIRQVGARTYPTSCLESGWIPSPLPAVYTGETMKAYRQWLKSAPAMRRWPHSAAAFTPKTSGTTT